MNSTKADHKPAIGLRPLVGYGLFLQCFFNAPQFAENVQRIVHRRDAAVTIAGPLDREFSNCDTQLFRTQENFHVKHESLGNAWFIELSCNGPAVHLESALGVGIGVRNLHEDDHEPMKQPGAEPAVGALRNTDLTVWKFT